MLHVREEEEGQEEKSPLLLETGHVFPVAGVDGVDGGGQAEVL